MQFNTFTKKPTRRSFFLLLFSIFFMQYAAVAQEFSIAGSLKDTNGNPLPYVTLTLVSQAESQPARYTSFSGELGQFTFDNVPAGAYIFSTHPAGYEPIQQEIMLSKDLVLEELIAKPTATAIDAVQVTAAPPVLERRPDRFLMHVSNSSFQTGNVMEIFQALPFMQVRGDELLINGRNKILVVVDNVQVPEISAAQVLSSMTAAEIDRIEFITTPGARYDAAVDAVIHIHTKKALTEGWTGMLTGNVSQGVYNRSNLGGNATYRKGKWGVRGTYNFGRNDVFRDFGGYQLIDLPSRQQLITTDLTEVYRVRSHNVKVDLSYEIAENHQLGASVGLVSAEAPGSAYTGYREFRTAVQAATDSILRREQEVLLRSDYQNYSINYRGKLDSLGKSVHMIATYTPVSILQQSEMLFQEVRNPDGRLLSTLPIIRNSNPNSANIWILQNDWELPFKNNWNVEAGVKYSGTRSDMLTEQSILQDNVWQELPDLTFFNRFYEDILAGYVSTQKKMNNTLIRASLRVENTVMGVESLYDRRFFDFFPHFMLQQDIGQRQFMLNYRRSIVRPGFSQLAPWVIYLDEYSSIQGNMSLRPTYTDQFLLNGTVIKNLMLELEYNHRRDQVVQLPEQEGLQTIYRFGNINGSEWAANANYSYKLTSWWSGMVHARGFRWAFDGIINESPVSDNDFAYTIGLTAAAKLPADVKLDLAYNYNSPYGLDGARFMQLNMARVALTKSFLQQRLSLTLAATDIFQGQRLRSEQQAGSLFTYHIRYDDVRRVSLGAVFQFGKKTVRQMQPNKLGNEDVINRAQ